MSTTVLPTTQQVRDCFSHEITEAGGQVLDTYDDGERLFLRSTLASTWEVAPKDGVQGGVALRTTPTEVVIHPYVFRQVCRNGAILAQALQTRRVERVPENPLREPEEMSQEVLAEVAAAVRECCAPEIFTDYTKKLRAARDIEADHFLQLVPYLGRLPKEHQALLIADFEKRYNRQGERSLYGLMNAVTAIARDTRDPELRWRLEEMGGAIPARLKPRVPSGDALVALRA